MKISTLQSVQNHLCLGGLDEELELDDDEMD
jgi:hypothetical protein